MEVVLKVREPTGVERQLTVAGRALVVGREAPGGLTLSDPKVSRNHLQIAFEAGAAVVADLGSTNGTFVNGTRVSRQALKTGDRVVAGDTEITVLAVNAGGGVAPTVIAAPGVAGFPPPPPPPPPPPAPQPHAPQGIRGHDPNSMQPNWVMSPNSPQAPQPAPTPGPAVAPPQPQAPVVVVNQPAGPAAPVIVMPGDKSLVGAAFLCWLLYYLGCFLIGLIMNLCYISEANSFQRTTGRTPSGTGCLWALLFVHVFLPIIAGIIIVLLIAAGVLSTSDISTW